MGYYVDRFKNGNDENSGGIQWVTDDNEVVVHYRDDLPREDMYAIGGTECGLEESETGTSDLHFLSDGAAPIISLSIGKS